MRHCLPLFILMMLVEGASAQWCPPVGPPVTAPVESKSQTQQDRRPDEIVAVIPGTMRMTTKLSFVVDTSGSMDNNRRVSQAITFARDTLGQPGDDLIVTIFAFKGEFTKWPGLPPDPSEIRFGPLPPKGWTEFPGVPQQAAAQRWLTEQGANGGTNPIGAMSAALAQEIKDLTVVLITDGEFFNHAAAFTVSVEAAQQARIKKGFGRAVIFVIGTGAEAAGVPHLIKVAKENGGGLHVIRRPRAGPEPATANAPPTAPPAGKPSAGKQPQTPSQRTKPPVPVPQVGPQKQP